MESSLSFLFKILSQKRRHKPCLPSEAASSPGNPAPTANSCQSHVLGLQGSSGVPMELSCLYLLSTPRSSRKGRLCGPLRPGVLCGYVTCARKSFPSPGPVYCSPIAILKVFFKIQHFQSSLGLTIYVASLTHNILPGIQLGLNSGSFITNGHTFPDHLQLAMRAYRWSSPHNVWKREKV